MKISVYTSCSTNYYAKARVLADSIKRNSPNTSLTLCLCDRALHDRNPREEGFARLWTPGDLGYDRSWIFQHTVMELCTAVKGRALRRLMEEEDADLFLYLDPDVYVYNDLAMIQEYMVDGSIGLIPHITKAETTEVGIQLTELSVLAHGTYNLGHLIVRPDESGRSLAKWWADRLDRFCFDDKAARIFTDQRWMDLAPALFDGVKVLRVPNLNLASWNIGTRSINQKKRDNESSFEVDGKPLITYHFSGVGPSASHRKIREMFAPSMGAVAELERLYEAKLVSRGQKQLEGLPPAFDFFDSGERVPAEARRMYRLDTDLQRRFPDPYSVHVEHSYIDWLRRCRPGVIRGGRVQEDRLEKAFHELFDEEFYLDRYPGARIAIENGHYRTAIEHYFSEGSELLYDPCRFFVTAFYLHNARNLDFQSIRTLPRNIKSTYLWHYLAEGMPYGIEPLEYFDSKFYINKYPDVDRAIRTGQFSTPLAHFQSYGSRENRKPGPELDPLILAQSDELRKLAHEGRHGMFGALLSSGRILGRSSDEHSQRSQAGWQSGSEGFVWPRLRRKRPVVQKQ